MNKKIHIVLLIILFILVLLIGIKLKTNGVPTISDELARNVRFSVSDIDKQWSIGLRQDETDNSDIWYLYVPSMVVPETSKVRFSGCSLIRLENSDGVISEYKSGDNLAGLEEGQIYDLSFCRKDEVLEEIKFMYIQAEDTAAAFINTRSGSMDYINENKNNSEHGDMLILDKDGSVNFLGTLKAMSGRGNTSWEKAKKPYALRLMHDASLLGMDEAVNWVLLSNYYDRSSVRNKVTKYIGKKLGFRYNTDSEFVDLYCNGEYMGLYELGEKVEVEENRLDIKDLEEENKLANIKKPVKYGAVSMNKGMSNERIGYDLPRNPLDITGGYLIEKNYSNRYTRFPSRFRTASGEKYVIRSPRHASLEEVEYIADIMQQIEEGAENGDDISDIADLKSFADKYLLEEFVANEASGATSSFFYKDSDSIDRKVYAGPPWDYDKCLGNAMKDFIDDTEHLNFLTAHTQGTRLFYNLYKNSENYRKLVKTEYQEVLRPAVVKLLVSKIDEFSMIPESDEMDAVRWGFKLDTVETNIESVRKIKKKRMDFFDKVFIEDEEIAFIHFNAEETTELGVIKGNMIGALPTVNDVTKWVNKDTGEEIKESTIVEGDITAVPAE